MIVRNRPAIPRNHIKIKIAITMEKLNAEDE